MPWPESSVKIQDFAQVDGEKHIWLSTQNNAHWHGRVRNNLLFIARMTQGSTHTGQTELVNAGLVYLIIGQA